jgi:hypothetical protein
VSAGKRVEEGPLLGAKVAEYLAQSRGPFLIQELAEVEVSPIYEVICKQWTKEPERFILNPIRQMPGLNR